VRRNIPVRAIVIFYFEDDNTGAASDAATLSHRFTDVFGFEEIIIEELEKKRSFSGVYSYE
jgi:hypothetical protein